MVLSSTIGCASTRGDLIAAPAGVAVLDSRRRCDQGRSRCFRESPASAAGRKLAPVLPPGARPLASACQHRRMALGTAQHRAVRVSLGSDRRGVGLGRCGRPRRGDRYPPRPRLRARPIGAAPSVDRPRGRRPRGRGGNGEGRCLGEARFRRHACWAGPPSHRPRPSAADTISRDRALGPGRCSGPTCVAGPGPPSRDAGSLRPDPRGSDLEDGAACERRGYGAEWSVSTDVS